MDAHEDGVHALLQLGPIAEDPELIALGRGARGDADEPIPHEHEGRGPERCRREEEGAVLHPQLEIGQAQGQAVGAKARRIEVDVDETVDLALVAPPRDLRPRGAALDLESELLDPGARLDRGEDLGVHPDGRCRVARGSLHGQPQLLGREAAARELGLRRLRVRVLELPKAEVGGGIPTRPGSLHPVQESRGAVGGGLVGARRGQGREPDRGNPERASLQAVASAGDGGFDRGRVTLNTLPRPGLLRTSIVPRWRSTISRAR